MKGNSQDYIGVYRTCTTNRTILDAHVCGDKDQPARWIIQMYFFLGKRAEEEV